MTKRENIEWIFENHGLPGWLGWGTYGAESTYGKAANDGGHGFGLIGGEYSGVTPNNNYVHNAEISATLYQQLVKQYGSVSAAVPHYSGNSYTISHPEALGKVGGKKLTFKGTPAEIKKHEELIGIENGEGKGEGENLKGGLSAVVPGLNKVTDPLSTITGFIAKLFDPTVWLRIGKAIAGFLLLAFGAITLMKVLVGVDIPTGAVSAGKLAAGLAA